MIQKIKKMIPNMITLSRVISFIVGFILFVMGNRIISICLYIYGSVSDFFDGYFARKWDAYSKFGSYLDAISDKFYALSIIILSVMNGNYFIIAVALLELIISIINYSIILKKENIYTQRVGKFKMTFEFMLLIVSLLTIEINYFWYLFIIFFVFTLYFQIQTINAYINLKNHKKQEFNVDYNGKSVKEKIKLLFKEFKYYLFNPVRIIK